MAEAILIERRFNGPPDSGHAGYTCGRLARFVDGSAAEVTLRQAPPLVKVLAAEADGEGGAVLRDRETTLAEARPIELDLVPPPPVQAEAAERAAKRSPVRDPDNHPSPTCFVCGPTRKPGDGLRIFAGPIDGGPVVAASWTPGLEFTGHEGFVYSPLIWAALDCPTSVPVANDPHDPASVSMVLARLAVRIDDDVHGREQHTIVAWPIEADGSERHAGAALYGSAGDLKAVARAQWIEVPPAAG